MRTIQRVWPDTKLTWVIGYGEHKLFDGVDKSAGVKAYFDLHRKLKSRRFSILLNMHASMRANVVSTLISADSRPAHMATAVRTPVVGLYATSNRFRTGSYFSQHLVVDEFPQAVQKKFGKSVGEIRWGTRVRDPEAMNLIQLDSVLEKIALVLEHIVSGDSQPKPNAKLA